MKKLILFIMLLLLIGLTGCRFTNNIGGSYNYDDFDKYSVGSFEKAGLTNKKILISWISGNVEVVRSEGSVFQAYEDTNETEDRYKMHYYDAGDIFYVRFCASQKTLNHVFSKKDLYIIIPNTYALENIEINGVSCNIEVEDLVLDEIKINTVSGNTLLGNIECNDLQISGVSGNVTLDTVRTDSLKINNVSGIIECANLTLKTVDIEVVSGNVDVAVVNNVTSISIKTISGNVRLHLPEDLGFTASISKISGDFSCAFPTTITDKKYIFDDGACIVQINTVSGNISILKL